MGLEFDTKQSIKDISQSEQFNHLLREELEQPDMIENLQAKVNDIIEKRLNELTPQLIGDRCWYTAGWFVLLFFA